jgi:hypothetical protein
MVKSLHRYQEKRSGRFNSLGAMRTANAFTLIEVVAVIVFIGVLILAVLPRYLAPPRTRSLRAGCQNTLKCIGLAFRTWEGDYSNKFPMSVPTNKGGTKEWGGGANMFRHFQVMSNELNHPKIVLCPADNRAMATDFDHINNKNVGYFIGLDADETFPVMPLSGDRNLIANGVVAGPGLAVIGTNDVVSYSKAIHNICGNVLLSDGSVQQVDSAGLQKLFQQSGTNLNRLAIP